MMTHRHKKGFFVTGTDTDVGKTWISAALIKALAAHYPSIGAFKPVTCGEGDQRYDDSRCLQEQATVASTLDEISPYAFPYAISPHLAALKADTPIDLDRIDQAHQAIQQRSDYVIVEGAGGWLAPIDEVRTMADVAKTIDLPVILVVSIKLGCLNHALLTQRAIINDRCHFAGWIANLPTPPTDANRSMLNDNIATLKDRLSAPLLGVVPYQANFDIEAIAKEIDTGPLRRC